MTFLPIVERELRVAARRSNTYWTRLLVAFGATVVGSSILIAEEGASTAQVGTYIFQGLAGLSLLYCVISGRRTTADCLSEEKREGTLGLLFLTDLKGYDIVFGKLVATSLNAFYALLAVFPVLAIPLVIGGVTNGEFGRVALVLMDTFLFSLAVGIFASACTRESRNAFALNFALLIALALVLPLIGGFLPNFFSPLLPARPLIPGTTGGPVAMWEFFYACPAYAFYNCFDAPFKTTPDQFWWCVGVIHGLTWLFVILTSWLVPRSWQDKPSRPATKRLTWSEFWQSISYGRVAKRAPFRKQLLDRNAFYWLAARARLKPIHTWIFLGLMAAWWTGGWLIEGHLWFDAATGIAMTLILNIALKMWVTIEAGQRLAEDQRNGALELLLTTPLSGQDIVRGQIMALRRQFFWPLVAVIGIELFLMLGWLGPAYQADANLRYFYFAGILMLLADIAASSLVALAAGLTARSHTNATLVAMSRILILPWLGLGIIAVAVNLWALLWGAVTTPEFGFYLAWWVGLGLAADILFGALAWRRLRHRFYELATQRFAPKIKAAIAPGNERLAAGLKPEQGKASLRRRTRRRQVVAVSICALLAVIVWLEFGASEPFPPPIVVSLGPARAPLKVISRSEGVYLILPDGQLWQWGGPISQRGLPRTPQTPQALIPKRVGRNQDWVQVGSTPTGSLGLLQDGTLWRWDMLKSNSQQGAPWVEVEAKEQVGSDHDWASLSCGLDHCVALKKDGTMYAWGNNSVNQAGYRVVPGDTPKHGGIVGNDDDNWTAVAAGAQYSLALRKDGTIWTWGQLSWCQPPWNAPIPTQISFDTNWVELTASWIPWARTQNGELWIVLHGPPNQKLPIFGTGRLLASNITSNQFAFAYAGQPKIYAVRQYGTLWEGTYAAGVSANGPATGWQQIGRGKYWTALWGDGKTAFGTTADGTLWTWGIDLGHDQAPTFAARINILHARLQAMLGSSTGPVGRFAPKYLKEPKPLMRFQEAGASPPPKTK